MSQDQSPTGTTGAAGENPTTAQAAKKAAAKVAGAAGAATDEAAAEAEAKVEEAKDRAREAAANAEDAAKHGAATGQHKVADGLRTAGDKVASLAEGEGVVSDLAGKASDGLKQASEWVSTRDPDAMMTQAKSFARRKPWVVAGIAAVALVVLNKITRSLTGGSKKH